MTQKTEAQRLADHLDLYATGDKHQMNIEDAAAEMRRLDAVNAQLLEALRTIAANASSVQMDPQWSVDVARAAIAAAKEKP